MTKYQTAIKAPTAQAFNWGFPQVRERLRLSSLSYKNSDILKSNAFFGLIPSGYGTERQQERFHYTRDFGKYSTLSNFLFSSWESNFVSQRQTEPYSQLHFLIEWYGSTPHTYIQPRSYRKCTTDGCPVASEKRPNSLSFKMRSDVRVIL